MTLERKKNTKIEGKRIANERNDGVTAQEIAI